MPKFKHFVIEGERCFPFYQVNVKVQIDGAPPEGWERSVVLGKPDRQWTNCMKRTPLYYEGLPTDEQLSADAQNFWDVNKDTSYEETSLLKGPRYPGYSDVEITIGEAKWETWMLDWFSHLTFRWGRTDAELLASFNKYVNRIERTLGYGSDQTRGVLMGAEDRWRWAADGRKGTPPPCVCEHCIKAGITRIDH